MKVISLEPSGEFPSWLLVNPKPLQNPLHPITLHKTLNRGDKSRELYEVMNISAHIITLLLPHLLIGRYNLFLNAKFYLKPAKFV